ncbi:hypothetical protein C8Q78DRAFT_190961 [Trametes maxima]|nr:hypothetical protein C8Q78DRAFT_190961 [Trametes maxima]
MATRFPERRSPYADADAGASARLVYSTYVSTVLTQAVAAFVPSTGFYTLTSLSDGCTGVRVPLLRTYTVHRSGVDPICAEAASVSLRPPSLASEAMRVREALSVAGCVSTPPLPQALVPWRSAGGREFGLEHARRTPASLRKTSHIGPAQSWGLTMMGTWPHVTPDCECECGLACRVQGARRRRKCGVRGPMGPTE